MEFTVPQAMTPGDRVAVIAPSSGSAHNVPHVLELALERLREVFDLDPVVYPTARQSDEFLANHPRARAADIHAAFKNPEIAGVFATIGGWEQLRVLRHLDSTVLREHPTRFYGMSDNTNLSLVLWNNHIVSYNGAQLMNELAVPGELPSYTERYCRRAFFEDSLGKLEPADEWTDDVLDWSVENYAERDPEYEPNSGWQWEGSDTPATGRLWGGCRTMIEWQLATDRYLPMPSELDGAILALETAEHLPDPTVVAGTLMCLGERGLLGNVAAVLIGRPPGRSLAEEPPREEREAYREQVYDAIIEQVEQYNPEIPVVLGLDWGHTTPIAPLSVGSCVSVNPETEEVVFQ